MIDGVWCNEGDLLVWYRVKDVKGIGDRSKFVLILVSNTPLHKHIWLFSSHIHILLSLLLRIKQESFESILRSPSLVITVM
jgi:hypothetical protein